MIRPAFCVSCSCAWCAGFLGGFVDFGTLVGWLGGWGVDRLDAFGSW